MEGMGSLKESLRPEGTFFVRRDQRLMARPHVV
jgi:hypothetical protein